ncbi:hypothetical protein HY750_02800 [Candidatus Kuenenbacteria bacterium]|nr:hypothetical protein [Candidatus Kuenenbacteria bacterium]
MAEITKVERKIKHKILESLEKEKFVILKNKEWEEQNEEYKFLQDKKISLENYIGEKRINLEEGYKKEGDEVVIGCIDSGIEKRIPLAGSGILFLTEDELLEFIKKRKVDVITSHDGCGAALIWARKKDLNINQEGADKLAMTYIHNIANKAGIKYRYIRADEMKRSQDFQPARMVFYNNIKDYYPSVIKGLPPTFSIERFTLFNVENAKERLKLAIKIAFGDHGFGERFTEKNPFIIACCLNEGDDFDEIKKEVNKILEEMDIKKERIKVDYFIVPIKDEQK